MISLQGELPSLFKSSEAKAALKDTLVGIFKDHLQKKRKGLEQREWEFVRKKLIPIGASYEVNIGSKLVESNNAHFFLSGNMSLEQLMASTVVLTDRTSDWSRVKVEDTTGTYKESIPDHVLLDDVLGIKVKLGLNGYVVKEEIPELVYDEEYELKKRDLLQIQHIIGLPTTEGSKVIEMLAFHGFRTQADVIEIRVGEIGKQHLEDWFNSLEGREVGKKRQRLTPFTVGTTGPVLPAELKRRVLFALETRAREVRRVKMLKILKPVEFIVSRQFLYNMVQETIDGALSIMHPEKVGEPIKGYPINKNHFNILKKEYEIEERKVAELESSLRAKFTIEFKKVLLQSLNEVLGIEQPL